MGKQQQAKTGTKTPKYVITAVNRLTGEREAISRPHTRWKTDEILARMIKLSGQGLMRSRAWKHPKVERAEREGSLF